MKDYLDKDFFDQVSGESQIYLGTRYLFLIARQMNEVSQCQKEALTNGGNTLWGWLNSLKQFYDLVENETGLDKSEKEIDFYEYISENGNLIRRDVKIKEKNKYEFWFDLIEKLLELNARIEDIEYTKLLKYNNDKRIIKELSNCQRALYRDANRKHLIMPKGKENMKELAKSSWIDREFKKDFD